MEPVASMAAYNIDTFYDGRAVAAAKKSIITADEQEFGVDSTINARFE